MFDWDDGNLDHIAEHDVSAAEAEEALLDPERIPATAYRARGERRRAVLGATTGGRLLYLVFIRRGPLFRVITARDASTRDRRRYRLRRG